MASDETVSLNGARGEVERWEVEAAELLASLRDGPAPGADESALVEKLQTRARSSIVLLDVLDLGTFAFVRGFLAPMLDLVVVRDVDRARPDSTEAAPGSFDLSPRERRGLPR